MPWASSRDNTEISRGARLLTSTAQHLSQRHQEAPQSRQSSSNPPLQAAGTAADQAREHMTTQKGLSEGLWYTVGHFQLFLHWIREQEVTVTQRDTSFPSCS